MNTAPPSFPFLAPEGVDCVHFNGYKPCFPGISCTDHCDRRQRFGTRILIVNLDAMGDVLMTTAQLAAIHRMWPEVHITWITLPIAAPLLHHNPLINRVIEWTDVNRLILRQEAFDVVLNADKSREACAFVASLHVPDTRGFTLSRRGQIIPANPAADYNFRMGIDDHLKFRVNTRTGQDILAETWELPYGRDPYILVMTDEELHFCEEKRREWGIVGRSVIGFNTGCSELYPNKKMTIDQHVILLDRLAESTDAMFLLLGGRDDAARNASIMERIPHLARRCISTPVIEGLRRGICYENLADLVVTGDSFGMHLAIALGKHVAAWFGLSCWEEIDLYDRGWKFFQKDLACSPCWKRVCPNNLECITGIRLDDVVSAITAYVLSHPPSPTEPRP